MFAHHITLDNLATRTVALEGDELLEQIGPVGEVAVWQQNSSNKASDMAEIGGQSEGKQRQSGLRISQK